MKFLCVTCDKPMALRETHGPFDGTMSIVYQCPMCDYRMAMLTNRAETQMVRSLGVKIGGRNTVAEPMETLRTNLARPREGVNEPERARSQTKCPFTGMVSDAFAADEARAPTWTSGARTRIANIPSFVQPMVRKNVEDYARERGYTEINETVMDEVKGTLGM